MSSFLLAILLSCLDGNTCTFQIDNKPVTVKLADVAAPAMQAHCDREHHLARSAKAFLTDALQRAKRIELDVRGKNQDNQTLAIIYADGKNVNQLLVDYEFAVSTTEHYDPMVWCPKELSRE